MPKLFHLHIENFRGIQSFDHKFKDGITCIIGRGDSGKTTILDAISMLLSPLYSLQFNDSDFYQGDVSKPIIIQGTLIELTDEIIRKFGSHLMGVKDGEISKSAYEDTFENGEPAVTIQLRVNKDLEPEWFVISMEEENNKTIKGSERELFNCFYISDYNDRHFSLSKGTPLSSLFKQKAQKNTQILNSEIIAELSRNSKNIFEEALQQQDIFNEISEAITNNTSKLGLNINRINASLDLREISFKENKISLHSENIPIRQHGKGSKRIISLAIQLALTDPAGIILIDEIEQGLEPDRAQQLVSFLNSLSGVQVIMTTHSPNVVQELSCRQLVIKRASEQFLRNIPEDFQGLVRSHPNALFVKKIIVSEGATEDGLLKAFDYERQVKGKKSLTYNGVYSIDGGGNHCYEKAEKLFELGYKVTLFCDSDLKDKKAEKERLSEKGVKIIDCEEGNDLEKQIFKDCTWDTIKELINYRIALVDNNRNVFENVKCRMNPQPIFQEDWFDNETEDLRKGIGEAASKSKWYKNRPSAIELGRIIFKKENSILPDSHLFKSFLAISEWIENV